MFTLGDWEGCCQETALKAKWTHEQRNGKSQSPAKETQRPGPSNWSNTLPLSSFMGMCREMVGAPSPHEAQHLQKKKSLCVGFVKLYVCGYVRAMCAAFEPLARLFWACAPYV